MKMMCVLEKRLKDNRKNKFSVCQSSVYLSLLKRRYNNVLEVGCGKGYFSYIGALNKKFKNCYGCDVFDDYQINEIAAVSSKAKYRGIVDSILPFEDNKFDLVLSMDVIEHVERDEQFLREQIRVCKKGGTIIVGTPNYWRITNIILKLIGRLKYPRRMGVDTYGEVIHLREYKREDLKKLVSKMENDGKIENIKIIGCWIGIVPLNIEIQKISKFFENFCQFWFVVFNKK